jgi:hypothetical protein
MPPFVGTCSYGGGTYRALHVGIPLQEKMMYWSGSGRGAKCIPPNLGTPFLTFSYPHYKTHKKDQKRSIEYHAYQPYRMRAEKNTNRT